MVKAPVPPNQSAINPEELATILDMIFCGIATIDRDGMVLFCNASAAGILKTTAEAIIGRHFSEVPVLDALDAVTGDVLLSIGRYLVEVSGEDPLVCNVNPWNFKGRRQGSILILHQSHNPNCIVQELTVTSRLLTEINIFIESSYDGFLVTDHQGNIIRVNKAVEEAFSMNRANLIGYNISTILDRGLYEKSAVLEACQTKKVSTTMIRLKDKEVIATAKPVFGGDGALASIVANLRDVTELNRLKSELEHQTSMAQGYYKQLITRANDQKSKIIAESKAMQNILHTVASIADVDSTVLITGESGTGKEIIVNEIYRQSHRNDHPIIKINCSAIPESLFESELFGYESGAFTDARKNGKTGFFELADGGTLFLDEVGELSMEGQAKLLRAIQEREIYRVGGSTPIAIDVRIIAATNVDLWQNINAGTFRKDLYYRLNVINIEIPPLRERREDILPLCMFFLNRYNRRHHRKKQLSFKMGQYLRKQDWLGNIRELENLIENLVVLTEGDLITPEQIPDRYRSTSEPDAQITIKGIIPLKAMQREAERQLFLNAQAQFRTTREMAEALGVNQSTISRKLQEYKGE